MDKFTELKLERIEEQITRWASEVKSAKVAHEANLADFQNSATNLETVEMVVWVKKSRANLEFAQETLTHFQARKANIVV